MVTMLPPQEGPPTLPKQQALAKNSLPAWLGALGGKPQPLQMGRGKEPLYLILPIRVDLPNGGVRPDHALQGCQLCMAQV